jgi:cytochrome c553
VKRLLAFAAFWCASACLCAPAFGAGDAASGKQKSQACAACHGPDGNAPVAPDFPRLAGQHYDYLLKALKDYKSGARKNPIMGGQVGGLSTQDMADLSAYFSSQQGTLHVIR